MESPIPRRMAISKTSARRHRCRRPFRFRAGSLRRPVRRAPGSRLPARQAGSKLLSLCRTNEACRRLLKLPGVGPVIATALVAAVADGRHFRSGRELAAWIGLVPRQYTTGGKPRLGGIGRRANHYLRRQMIYGARAVMFRVNETRGSPFLVAERGWRRGEALIGRLSRLPRDGKDRLGRAYRKEDYLAAA